MVAVDAESASELNARGKVIIYDTRVAWLSNRCGGRLFNVHRLHDEVGPRCCPNDFARRQVQLAVLLEQRVERLEPRPLHRPVQHYPLANHDRRGQGSIKEYDEHIVEYHLCYNSMLSRMI